MPTAVVYIKITGMISVISGCTGLGILIGMHARSRYRLLISLRQMFRMMREELRYAGSELPELLRSMIFQADGPLKYWMKQLIAELDQMSGATFDQVWCTTINEYLSESALNKQDLIRLKKLGSQLGYLDKKTQLASLEWYIQELDTELEETGKTVGQKQKVSVSLGILSGLLLTVFLLS